jgi:undecaprenyl-diphosphatase
MVGYGFSVYVVCQIGLPRWLRLLFGLTVGLLIVGIGFSRLYLGEHFLTDVLGGWAMASGVLAILMIFTSLWRRPSAAKRSSSNTG